MFTATRVKAFLSRGVLLCLLVMCGCATVQTADWYTVTGTGAADESLPPTQQRLMALQAAKKDAQRQLLEAAKGVRIDSSTTVRDFITRSDVIESRVTGTIRGAQMVEEPVARDDNSVEVKMRLDMNKVRDAVR